MKRTSINHVGWGANFSLDQAVLTQGAQRTLHCSGQTAMVEDDSADMGLAVDGVDDPRRQMQVALANIDAMLKKAAMTRQDIVRLTIFATDIPKVMQAYDIYVGWIGEAGITPAQSMIGVSHLVSPDLLLEIEITAQQ